MPSTNLNINGSVFPYPLEGEPAWAYSSDAIVALSEISDKDRSFALYVSKNGNDLNDGRTPQHAFLTIQAAINKAVLGVTAKIVVKVIDGSEYTENITLNCNVYAPHATIIGNITQTTGVWHLEAKTITGNISNAIGSTLNLRCDSVSGTQTYAGTINKFVLDEGAPAPLTLTVDDLTFNASPFLTVNEIVSTVDDLSTDAQLPTAQAVEERADLALTDANSYADGVAGQAYADALFDASAYADSVAGQALIDAKDYADAQDLGNDNVTITTPADRDLLEYQVGTTLWKNRANPAVIAKNMTGFVNPEDVVITYSPVNRTITLTGTWQSYWQGKAIAEIDPTFVTGWVSTAHDLAPMSTQFLYFNGTAFVWSSTPWTFDMLMIVAVVFDSAGNYIWTLRESHGLMDRFTHAELHATIGTYLVSGGDISDLSGGGVSTPTKGNLTTSTASTSGAGTLTISHTQNVGANGVLTCQYMVASTTTVSGATYNGVAMTIANDVVMDSVRYVFFTLANPSTGANNLVITTSTNFTTSRTAILSFTGCTVGATQRSAVDNNGSPASDNRTVTAGSILYAIGQQSTTGTTPVFTGLTQDYLLSFTTQFYGSVTAVLGAGVTTLTSTWSLGSSNTAILSLELLAVGSSSRRPSVAATVLADEDLNTSLTALAANGPYQQMYLTGLGAMNTFVVDAADIIPVSGSRPYYNLNTAGTWSQALFTTTHYGKIYLMSVPVASDGANGQKRKFVWIQPQTTSATLATIQAITPANITLGPLASASPEYCFIGEVIIRYIGGDWSVISSAKLTGTKVTQVATPSNSFLSTVTTDSVSLTGLGTVASPLKAPLFFSVSIRGQAVVGVNQASFTCPIAGTLSPFYIKVGTAPTGATLIGDVNKNGTSLWASTQANRPTIAISGTSATSGSLDTTTVAAGDTIIFDTDQVGSTISGGSDIWYNFSITPS